MIRQKHKHYLLPQSKSYLSMENWMVIFIPRDYLVPPGHIGLG